MAGPTNEDLMRLADGNVSAAERERMFEELAKDADARQRYAMFTATTPDALAAPFAKIANAPVPQHLVDLIMAASKPGASTTKTASPQQPHVSREGLLADLFGRFSRLLTPQWAPAFATGLLVVGAGIGALLQSALTRQAPDTASVGPPPAVSVTLVRGRLEASGVLLRTLEKAGSGEAVVAIAGQEAPGHAEARFTFKATTHEFCRQYLAKDHGGQYFAGIACRETSGAWLVRHHVQIPKRPSPREKGLPANDPVAVLAPEVDKMMGGDVMGREEEAAALAKQWQE